VVVGIPLGVGEKLDEEEPGWKISGKYVSPAIGRGSRPLNSTLQAVVLLSGGRPNEEPQFA